LNYFLIPWIQGGKNGKRKKEKKKKILKGIEKIGIES
jgi:hypothetical protein